MIQPADGKILVIADVITGASRDFGVLRLNPNGTLDTNFGGAGGQALVPFDLGGTNDDDPSSLLLDAQGNIIVAGTADGASSGGGSDFAVTRLTPGGALDTTFSGDGKATVAFDLGPAGQRKDAYIRAVLQGDGKIVLVGKAQTLARLTATG